MKHNIEKIIPEKKVTVVDFKTCDICKRPDRASTSRVDTCDLDNVEIEYNDVECRYPECGSGEKYIYDICEECFKEKVIPALCALGAEPSIEPWDY